MDFKKEHSNPKIVSLKLKNLKNTDKTIQDCLYQDEKIESNKIKTTFFFIWIFFENNHPTLHIEYEVIDFAHSNKYLLQISFLQTI